MTLFDVGKEEYKLFDAMRFRFIRGMTQMMDEREAEEANDYFVRLKCGHLRWKKQAEQKARIYTIKNYE